MVHGTQPRAERIFDAGFGGQLDVLQIPRQTNANDDQLTAQTIQICTDLVKNDTPKPIVQRSTRQALRDAGLTAAATDKEKCDAVWSYLKRRVQYVREAQQTADWNLQLDPELEQVLIPPAELLHMEHPRGDCPHFSMAAAAMLRVLGIGSSFKTIAADKTQPNAYSHVFLLAYPNKGHAYPVDASNAPGPGMEYAGHITKAKIWPIDDKKAPAPSAATLRGLGDDMVTFGSEDGPQFSGAQVSSGSDDSGSSFDFASALNTTIKDIAGPILRAQYAVPNIPKGATFQQRNVDGSITQLSNAAGTSFGSLGTGGNSSLLMYGALAVAGLVLISSMSKGK